MEKFSNNYLSYFSKLPKAESMPVFIPIWLTKIVAPRVDRKKPNLFQQTVLALVNVGQNDRTKMAEWLGVDIELIDIIIDTELLPNGWLTLEAGRLLLTENGKEMVNQKDVVNIDKEIYYVVQDAITLKFWPRLIHKTHYIDVYEENNELYIIGNRETGSRIKPFIIYPERDIAPQQLSGGKVLNIINLHRRAFFSQSIRNEEDEYQLKNINIDDFEIIDNHCEPFYILTNINKKSITMSMSRKGTPADNAPIESFHSVLKSETFYRYPELKSSTKIISQTVINFIHKYNNNRIQKKLGFMSPIEYGESQIPA